MPVTRNANQPAPPPDPAWFASPPTAPEHAPGDAIWRDRNGLTFSEQIDRMTHSYAIIIGVAVATAFYAFLTITGICN